LHFAKFKKYPGGDYHECRGHFFFIGICGFVYAYDTRSGFILWRHGALEDGFLEVEGLHNNPVTFTISLSE
jgi:hypothetical protein